MNLLDRLQLSFRCPADWDAMEGDERSRYCSHCRKNVHNLSAMSRDEAEALVRSGKDLCVRMVRRVDGSAGVKGCPKTRATRDAAARLAGAGLAVGSALALANCREEQAPVMGIMCPPERATQTQGDDEEVILGEIAPPEDPDEEAAVDPEQEAPAEEAVAADPEMPVSVDEVDPFGEEIDRRQMVLGRLMVRPVEPREQPEPSLEEYF